MGIPMLQIRENSVLMYAVPFGGQTKHLQAFRSDNLKRQREHAYKGLFSTGAKKRLAKAVTLLVQTSTPQWIYNPVTKRQMRFRVNFITLTVSSPLDKMTGREAYDKLLVHFLQWLRRTKGCKNYVWKLEFQANGQIHYHITTDTFIPYSEIRDKWNNLQRREGIINSYREAQQEWHKNGFKVRKHLLGKWNYKAQKNAYEYGVKTNWENPNSVDVHKVNSVDDLTSYIVKEVTKECQNIDPTVGKIWDCSDSLKRSPYYSMECTSHNDKIIDEWSKDNDVVVVSGDHFKIIKCGADRIAELMEPLQLKMFTDHLDYIKNPERYSEPPPSRCLVSSQVNQPEWENLSVQNLHKANGLTLRLLSRMKKNRSSSGQMHLNYRTG